MSHTGLHEKFAEMERLQLTGKERQTLARVLKVFAEHEREDVYGALLKHNAGQLTFDELSDLQIKIWGADHPSVAHLVEHRNKR